MRNRNLLIFIIFLALSAGVFALCKFYASGSNDILSILFMAAGMLLSFFFFNMLFHEGGHLIAGLLSDMKFYSMSIGILKFTRTKKFIKVSFPKKYGGYGGFTQMVPKHSKNLKNRYIRHLYGGLIGSIIHMLLCCIPLFFLPDINYIFVALFTGQIPAALIVTVINYMPFRVGMAKTDGAVIRELKNNQPESVLAVNVLTAGGQMFLGKSPSQIDKELLFNDYGVKDGDVNKFIQVTYRYCYYLDTADQEGCNTQIQAIESHLHYLPDVYKLSAEMDVLYNMIIIGDESRAKVTFERLEEDLYKDESATAFRILGAYYKFILKDEAESKRLFEHALKLCGREPVLGVAEMERNLIMRLDT